jgi:hypothetical protein
MMSSASDNSQPDQFTGLTQEQCDAIRSTHDWPPGTDWCGAIEQAGRQFSERRAEREAWLKKNLRGKTPAEEKKRVERALLQTREDQKAWADSVLDDTDLPVVSSELRFGFTTMVLTLRRSPASAIPFRTT